MPRRYDPERRQRIIDAAIRVAEERGIGALSHRVVAAAADVPLGSTTYHFASLDDLLVAALRQVCGEAGTTVEGWTEYLERDAPLADRIADLLAAYMDESRSGRVRMEYELYLAALRRPALSPVAAEWLDSTLDVLARYTDLGTARTLSALIDGMLLQSLLTGRPFDRDEVRAEVARVVGEEPVPDGPASDR
ncbi:TetR/AcrR family transcriptional regulator [Streptomyces purpurogeneiscleroticus]|uniref:TetR/AcrR family transcriptional regulator n=1 Tax=Streptomyces purpurogeneiscleroticus TaxID=68259 RepID=UPI001CC1ADE1|nr:TetR family transcriptional regulator [Streptomyces purpurogeneiscleroticus]